MFCKNCGSEIKSGAGFCGKCGTKINNLTNNNLSQAKFYSEDWTRRKSFAIASLPYYDVMIDDNYLYFIKLPKYSSSTVGLLVGLVLFNIIGAIIGTMIGNSSDAKKRKAYRETWINSGQQVISHNFEKNIAVKIPIIKAKDLLTREKHQIIFFNGDEKFILRKNKDEVERLNSYL